jgi:nucleoside-diphosphate-sugar epimerase
MKVLVTGSAGHLGEALMRTLPGLGHVPVGLDIAGGRWVDAVGSVDDRQLVRDLVAGADAVVHTATLHKPHVGTHPRDKFVQTNVTGTLVLLEEAARAGVGSFVFTSSTSVFGRAAHPGPGEPAAWITEDVVPQVRNIYGASKHAAEALCELVARDAGLPTVILRTSRFFPELDDIAERRNAHDNLSLKVSELLYRRCDLEDVVSAHLQALRRASELGFARYVISATTPFSRADLGDLRHRAPAVVARHFPEYEPIYALRGWTMLAEMDRVYDNSRARDQLGWEPQYSFGSALRALAEGRDPRSEIARTIGAKGYHDRAVGVYTQR